MPVHVEGVRNQGREQQVGQEYVHPAQHTDPVRSDSAPLCAPGPPAASIRRSVVGGRTHTHIIALQSWASAGDLNMHNNKQHTCPALPPWWKGLSYSQVSVGCGWVLAPRLPPTILSQLVLVVFWIFETTHTCRALIGRRDHLAKVGRYPACRGFTLSRMPACGLLKHKQYAVCTHLYRWSFCYWPQTPAFYCGRAHLFRPTIHCENNRVCIYTDDASSFTYRETACFGFVLSALSMLLHVVRRNDLHTSTLPHIFRCFALSQSRGHTEEKVKVRQKMFIFHVLYLSTYTT